MDTVDNPLKSVRLVGHIRNASRLSGQDGLFGWLEFNGSFSTKKLFSAIMSYNLLYKQISFIYCSIEEG